MGDGPPQGAVPLLDRNGYYFRAWAPRARKLELHLVEPWERLLPMTAEGDGHHWAVVEGLRPGARYYYRLDGSLRRPDPASRYQPHGVHGPSQVVDPGFDWHDDGWRGLPLEEIVLYELHVGTFTPEGTFDAVVPYLDTLCELGVTAVELMPVAQFPGGRNWGYDGVYPFAVQNTYGGPDGLKRLVQACHDRGLAVVLDVVYNHLGPEGNYLGDFGPYFTDRYRIGWGSAVNFDGPHSDPVRRYFLDNALTWLAEFHIDGLRLDAVHAIKDFSAVPFLQQLADETHHKAEQHGRQFVLIAESALNDVRVLRPPDRGGWGIDAQWNFDFHNALHALMTGERGGYYADFGTTADLATAYREGFVLTGRYSHYRLRSYGVSSAAEPARQFVVYSQTHDETGNRPHGDRLGRLVPFDALKTAAAAVILSPYVPLLFMGEEYGETAPFPYFISHSDRGLIEAVRQGRRRDLATFGGQGPMPDPQDEAVFKSAVLRHHLRGEGRHRVLWEFYQELLRLRRTLPALACLSKEQMAVEHHEAEKVLLVRRWVEGQEVLLLLGFSNQPVAVAPPAGRWRKLLDAAEGRWLGTGHALPAGLADAPEVLLPAHAAALYERVPDVR